MDVIGLPDPRNTYHSFPTCGKIFDKSISMSDMLHALQHVSLVVYPFTVFSAIT